MFAKLRRVLPAVIGLTLISLVIWYAGPALEFRDYPPLAPAWIRLALIVAVWLLWYGSGIWATIKARRAGNKLAAAIVQQSAAAEASRPSAEAVQLREGFEQAVATLTDKRRGGRGLYDLPWYVIIGPPGSGKTTALVNSGLHFPLEQKSGRSALRGIGGTRNCDWWFTDEAVLLDTAGRYTTQDSDEAADSTGWSEFLGLLRKYRRRRPVNGVILTISAQDLMTQLPGAPDPHVEAARRRLNELNRELKIQVPVYVLVTKCDLIAGFTEYFDDLPQDGRAQVWGVTFPIEQTKKGEAAAAFPAEFDALVARLNERVFGRVEEDRDLRRRAAIFAFPQQLAALRAALTGFVGEVFGATRFDHQTLLRGVYFTSGTQEGTPIDRLLGALGRRFAIAPDTMMAAPAGRGRAYFIDHVLHQVMFRESGLAGVDRRFEVQWAAAQVGAYAAMAAVAVLALVLWTVSYSRNRSYVDDVSASVARLAEVPPAGPAAPLEASLPRLEAVRGVVDAASRFADATPWATRRWGLFQGTALTTAATDAYARELRGALLPHVAARFRQRLVDYAAEPERLYPYLKGYLMLGNPKYLDREELEYMAKLEWDAAYAGDPDRAEQLGKHFRSLIDYTESFPAQTLDTALVAQAQSSLRQASQAGLIYRYLRIDYANDASRDLRLDLKAGLGADRVLRLTGGPGLAEPMPGIFTKPVFEEIKAKGILGLVTAFIDEYWVWGDSRPSITATASLSTDVMNLYESDYIAAWDRIVQQIKGAPTSSLAETKEAVAILGAPTSPLRGLLKVVDENTYLVAPEQTAKPGGIIGNVTDKFKGALEAGKQKLGVVTTVAGARITAHFADIHRLLGDGSGPAPIDGVMQTVQELAAKLQPIGPQVGGTNPNDPASIASVGQTANELKREAAGLPAGIATVLSDIANSATTAVRGGVSQTLQNQYEQDVVRECSAIVANRYPFTADARTDVPLADFGRLFGYDGVYDTFFKEQLADLVDRSRSQWAWRSDASGAAVGGSLAMLRQFELADRIRAMYFRPGERTPQLAFRVDMPDLDVATLRFGLDLEGQTFEYKHGPDFPKAMTWPGPKPGSVVVTFEGNGPRQTIATEGEWAWFRLIDNVPAEPESETAYTFALEKGGQRARLRVTAPTIRNPFGKRLLQQFRCR